MNGKREKMAKNVLKNFEWLDMNPTTYDYESDVLPLGCHLQDNKALNSVV